MNIKFYTLGTASSVASLTFATVPISRPRQAVADAETVWVARSCGNAISPTALLRKFPRLKVLYVPMLQFWPKAVSLPGLNFEAMKVLKLHGVKIWGIFAPMEIGPEEKSPRYTGELRLGQAFAPAPKSISHSLFDEKFYSDMRRELSKILGAFPYDGVVFALSAPRDQLYCYSASTREYFVQKYHMDPVDVGYPLGSSNQLVAPANESQLIIVKERLSKVADWVIGLGQICRQVHVQSMFLSDLDAYRLPLSTRAAEFADWARWLIQNPETKIILGTSDDSQNYAQRAILAAIFARRAKIDPRQLLFLATGFKEYINATKALKLNTEGLAKSQLVYFYTLSGK